MKIELIWGFELLNFVRGVWLLLCPTEWNKEMNWTYWNWNHSSRSCAGVWNSKVNLNIFEEIFQLNIHKALTCSSKNFKLKEAVLLSSAAGWPWLILSLGLHMRIWAEWWALQFNFCLPSPDWILMLMWDLCVSCVYSAPWCTYIYIYGITFRNSVYPEQLFG